jgi:hypothetical protein
VLAGRLKKVKNEESLLDFDQILSLLRLAPENRAKALKAAKNLPGEFAAAFRYACGEDTKKIGKTYYLWVAAARARRPYEDDRQVEKRFPNLGPDAGRAARYDVRLKSQKKAKRPGDIAVLVYAEDSPKPHFNHQGWRYNPKADYRLPTTLPHETSSHSDCLDTQPCEPAVFELAASVWTIARESFFVPNANVKPLFDVNAPLLEMSTHGLVRALADEWLPHRTMGVDLAITAIEDGRWDAARVGRLLAVEIHYANRFAKTLPEIAGVSPLHAFQATQSLIEMLACRPVNCPPTFAGLLELLYELMEELQLDLGNQNAAKYLKAITGSGKAARLAKRLVEFQPEAGPDLAAIFEQAIRGRLTAGRQIARP